MTRKRQHLPSPRRAAAAPVLAKIVHPDQLCRMPHRRCHAAMPLNGEKTPLPARNALRRVTPCYAVAPLRQRAVRLTSFSPAANPDNSLLSTGTPPGRPGRAAHTSAGSATDVRVIHARPAGRATCVFRHGARSSGAGRPRLRDRGPAVIPPGAARRLFHRWASLGGIASDPLRAGGASREITARGGAVRRPFVLVSFPF